MFSAVRLLVTNSSSVWLIACLALAACFAWRGVNQSEASSELLTRTTNTKSIEDIGVGERVALAENPAEPFDDTLGVEVDPATWRMIRLRVDKADGGAANVVLLRPVWWIEERLESTARQLTLSVPEVGIDGAADVLSVEPCPPILAGQGSIVSGTFAHAAPSSVEIFVEETGEPIRCTAEHPFWSHDKQMFRQAQALLPGERLLGNPRICTVERVVPVAQPTPVYNLEVFGRHVFEVSSLGILVHNAPCNTPVPREGPHGVDPDHHNANVMVRNSDGQLRYHSRFVSGNMTPEEQVLGFPKNTLASHTEARALRSVALQPGETMTITGQNPPCNSCKGAMNRAVRESGAAITYRWRDGGATHTWTAGS